VSEAGRPDRAAPAASALGPGEFFDKARGTASEWARFADPKVLVVFILLGLGFADLIKNANALIDAHHQGGVAGWTAALGFLSACALAVVTVGCASVALFPRTHVQSAADGTPSLYFFGGIAALPDAASYERAVRERSATELESELAQQAWEVSRIAVAKLQWTKRAYAAVIVFLVVWALARIALSFV